MGDRVPSPIFVERGSKKKEEKRKKKKKTRRDTQHREERNKTKTLLSDSTRRAEFNYALIRSLSLSLLLLPLSPPFHSVSVSPLLPSPGWLAWKPPCTEAAYTPVEVHKRHRYSTFNDCPRAPLCPISKDIITLTYATLEYRGLLFARANYPRLDRFDSR